MQREKQKPADAAKTKKKDPISHLVALAVRTAAFLLHEPWLLAALWFSGLGFACLGIHVSQTYPWVPLFGISITCLLVWIVMLIEFKGLLALLPGAASRALERPVYELLSEGLNAAAEVVCNVIRLMMLACMELREEQRRELLMSMDPDFRDFVFRQPSGRALPWPLRRILLGRAESNMKPPSGPEAAAATDPTLLAARQHAQSRRNSSAGNSECAAGDADSFPGDEQAGSSQPPVEKRDSMFDLVRGVETVAQNSAASAKFASMERILAQKMVTGTTAFAARNLASTAQAQATDAFEYGKEKVTEISDTVLEAAAEPRIQATAVGGAVALGAGGAATGLVSGGAIGAALGIVPALFTFGLSIPIGAAIGSGIGAAAGSVTAGAAGFVGGGALGYGVYGGKKDEDGTIADGQAEEVPESEMPGSADGPASS